MFNKISPCKLSGRQTRAVPRTLRSGRKLHAHSPVSNGPYRQFVTWEKMNFEETEDCVEDLIVEVMR